MDSFPWQLNGLAAAIEHRCGLMMGAYTVDLPMPIYITEDAMYVSILVWKIDANDFVRHTRDIVF